MSRAVLVALLVSACSRKSPCERAVHEAQLACIEGMKTFADMQRIASCPAIAANKPSWLIVPPAP